MRKTAICLSVLSLILCFTSMTSMIISYAQDISESSVTWSETIPNDSELLYVNMPSGVTKRVELYTAIRRGTHYINNPAADYVEIGDMAVYAETDPVSLKRNKIYLLSQSKQTCVDLKLDSNNSYVVWPGRYVIFVYDYNNLYRIEAGGKKVTKLQNIKGDLFATDGDDVYLCTSEQESPVYRVKAGEVKGKVIGKINADVLQVQSGRVMGLGQNGIEVLTSGKKTIIKDFNIKQYAASVKEIYKFERNEIKQLDANYKSSKFIYAHTAEIRQLVYYKDNLLFLDENNALYRYDLLNSRLKKLGSKKIDSLTLEGGVPVIEKLEKSPYIKTVMNGITNAQYETTVVEHVVKDNKMLCVTATGMLELRDAKSQMPLWSYPLSGPISANKADEIRMKTQLAITENYIYCKDSSNRLLVFNLQGELLEKNIGDDTAFYETNQSELFFSGSERAWVKNMLTDTTQSLYEVSPQNTWVYEKNNYSISREVRKGIPLNIFTVTIMDQKSGKNIYQSESNNDPRLIGPNVLLMSNEKNQAVLFSLLSGKITPIVWHPVNGYSQLQSCVQYTDMHTMVYFKTDSGELYQYNAQTGETQRIKDNKTYTYVRAGLGQHFQAVITNTENKWQLKDYDSRTIVELPNLKKLYLEKAQRYTAVEALSFEWQYNKVYIREQVLLKAIYNPVTKTMLVIG